MITLLKLLYEVLNQPFFGKITIFVNNGRIASIEKQETVQVKEGGNPANILTIIDPNSSLYKELVNNQCNHTEP